MEMNKFVELAYLRNRLASSNFAEEEKQLMYKIKQEISGLNTPFKNIALNAINNCEKDLKVFNFKSATQEIQLIHNFTFKEPYLWDISHFYRIELLSYLEQIDDIDRIKNLFMNWRNCRI